MFDLARRGGRRATALIRPLLFGALVGGAAIAQAPNAVTVARERDAALADIRRLDTLLVQRTAEFRRIDREVSAAGEWVRVSAGPFRMQVAPELVEHARTGAHAAAEALAPTADPVVRDALAQRLPVVGLQWQKVRLGKAALIWFRADTDDRASIANGRRYPLDGAAEEVRSHLVALAEELAAQRADSVLRAWLRSSRIPLSDRDAKTWSRAYRDFAATASIALRSCREGDPQACLTSLGIADAEGIAWSEWYAAEDYSALLDAVPIPRTDTATRLLAKRCRTFGDTAACDTAVARLAPASIPAPLPAAVRALFLHEVLRTGGPGSYERLLSAPGTLPERFAVAAGRPLDDVVASWRRRLDDARPASMTVSPIVAGAVLGWCVLFTMVGFSRKTLA